MNIDQLKKAAGRYARHSNIPLSEAQELLSNFFGYKTFHDAQRSITSRREKASIEVREEGSFFDGLSHSEFLLLLHCLKQKHLSILAGTGGPEDWLRKGAAMLEACILAMPSAGIHRLNGVDDLRAKLQLDEVESLYISLVKKYGLPILGKWPRPALKLHTYLDGGLPGFQIQRLLEKHGLTDNPTSHFPRSTGLAAVEQHAFRFASLFSTIFNDLYVIEDEGGVGNIEIVGHDPITSLSSLLRTIANEKRLPRPGELNIFNSVVQGEKVNIYA